MNRTSVSWIKGGEVVHTQSVFGHWDEVNESLLQKLFESEDHKAMEEAGVSTFEDYLHFADRFVLEIAGRDYEL